MINTKFPMKHLVIPHRSVSRYINVHLVSPPNCNQCTTSKRQVKQMFAAQSSI